MVTFDFQILELKKKDLLAIKVIHPAANAKQKSGFSAFLLRLLRYRQAYFYTGESTEIHSYPSSVTD